MVLFVLWMLGYGQSFEDAFDVDYGDEEYFESQWEDVDRYELNGEK